MIKLIPIYILILLFNSVAWGQNSASSMNDLPIAITSGEAMSLFTDRNFYCSGEHIYFAGEYSCIKDLDSLRWSNVVYIELISWNGAKLSQMKLKIGKPQISGCIRIPDDVISGNYYLRAYTKWMRNFSVYNYAYVPVRIVNPYLSEIDRGPDSPSIVTENDSSKRSQILPVSNIVCSTNKRTYKPGEKAQAGIYPGNQKEHDTGRYYVTIARAGTIDTTFQFHPTDSFYALNSTHEFKYLPELQGITISGEVINQVTGFSVKDIPVSLSEAHSGSYFSVYHTNEKGKFVFSLPDMTGKRDFFIQAEIADSLPVKLMVDEEYCVNPVRLPYVEFSIDEDKYSMVREMVINKQLSEKFSLGENLLTDTIPEKTNSIPFYGSKRTIYNTDKYIELPTIEEFIFEIVFEAHIKTNKGVTTIVTKGKTAFSNYPPLILIDNIHVSNYTQLLKVPINKIKRVEAVDKGYVVGNMKYNGLISIYSRNGDFAGIDLKKNSRFFTCDLFSKPNTESYPQIRSFDTRIPDRRNLVYWNPDIQLSGNSKTTISFDIPDTRGEYVILIRSKRDPAVHGNCHFTVK